VLGAATAGEVTDSGHNQQNRNTEQKLLLKNAITVLTFPLFAIYLKRVNLTKFPI
jgi:hypothetical protein